MDMTAALIASLIGVIYPIITRQMLNDLIPQQKYKLIIAAGVALLALYYIRKRLDCFVQYKGHVMGVYIQADSEETYLPSCKRFPSLSSMTTKPASSEPHDQRLMKHQ